jgi:hypothetical protein
MKIIPGIMIAAFVLAGGTLQAAEAATSLQEAAQRLMGRQALRDITSPKARKTVRGASSVWTDVVVQKPEASAASAFANLEADLKLTDVEGQLRDAGFKVMDPKKRSLAIGLRPTLSLMVLRSPKGADGNAQGFYLVVANAVQDVQPLGGSTVSMVTWAQLGDPIAFSGDDHKDIDAIRLSAREVVKAFIRAAQDKE